MGTKLDTIICPVCDMEVPRESRLGRPRKYHVVCKPKKATQQANDVVYVDETVPPVDNPIAMDTDFQRKETRTQRNDREIAEIRETFEATAMNSGASGLGMHDGVPTYDGGDYNIGRLLHEIDALHDAMPIKDGSFWWWSPDNTSDNVGIEVVTSKFNGEQWWIKSREIDTGRNHWNPLDYFIQIAEPRVQHPVFDLNDYPPDDE